MSEQAICGQCSRVVVINEDGSWACACGRSRTAQSVAAIVAGNAAPPGALAYDAIGNRLERSYAAMTPEELREQRNREAQEISRAVFEGRVHWWKW